MKPKPQPRDAFELFQAHFDQMLDPSHELVVLANKIGWPGLDAAFADCYRPDIGAPGKAVRLMVGLHEPEVRCISKGKAHKRYEFGRKIAVATTNRSKWIVAAPLMPDNPYDGHTLSDTLATVENVTGVSVTDAYVDKGYRGHGYTGV